MKQYRKKSDQFVVAIQLALEMHGFEYEKWGGTQTCKSGDWLLENNGEVYTVDAAIFEETYERKAPGIYAKNVVVWAEQAVKDGHLESAEGGQAYQAGRYLVSNDESKTDVYAVAPAMFERMYEPID